MGRWVMVFCFYRFGFTVVGQLGCFAFIVLVQEPCCSTSWQILEIPKETFKVQIPPSLNYQIINQKKKSFT